MNRVMVLLLWLAFSSAFAQDGTQRFPLRATSVFSIPVPNPADTNTDGALGGDFLKFNFNGRDWISIPDGFAATIEFVSFHCYAPSTVDVADLSVATVPADIALLAKSDLLQKNIASLGSRILDLPSDPISFDTSQIPFSFVPVKHAFWHGNASNPRRNLWTAAQTVRLYADSGMLVKALVSMLRNSDQPIGSTALSCTVSASGFLQSN